MTDKLNLQEIVDALAEKEGITKKLADTIVKEFSELITEGLEKDGKVKVRGLGTFRLKKVAKRMGRNLQTGEPIEIPPHNKVTFNPEKQLKETVNEQYEMLTYKELPTPPPASAKGEKEPEKKEEKPAPPPPSFEKKDKQIPKPPPTPAPSPSPTPSSTPTSKPFTPPPPPPPPKKADKEDDGRGKRRSYYWIIPVAIIIIGLLIILFYFRACRDEEQEPVEPPLQEEVITPAEPAPDEKPVIPEEPEPEPEPETTLYTLKPGNYLYQLSGFFYGDSLFWVLIYKANAGQIDDPEIVTVGEELVIPPLEGDRFNLTRNDSLNLSEGYRMLYEYYNSIGHPAAQRYYFGMKRYQPN